MHSHRLGLAVLTSVIVLILPACGGGGGGDSGGSGGDVQPDPSTIHIIDAYEVPRRVSDLYRVLAGAGHNDSRANLAASVYAGSNAQSSNGTVVTVSLVRDSNGKLLGSTGSFSVSKSYRWHVGDSHCPCSIYTRAWFFDEDGQELLSWDSEPNISSLSLALLVSAKHDVVQGMWYQDDGVFGVFSDGTRPDDLPTLGTASYVGSIYGMLVESAGSPRHHEAVAALTLEVAWGATPTLSGRAGAIHAYELSIDAQGTMTSTMSPMTLSSTISFSGGVWSSLHKAFHNGSIGCGEGCEMTVGSQGLWNAHFVDTGTVSVDPFMLSGTFGLYKYLFGGNEYDFIGFIHGSTPPPVPPENPTIHIIDAYEVPRRASDLYRVLAGSDHNDSRARLAASVYAGSNAQISDGSVVTISLVRDDSDKLLGSTGSFSVSLSDGWHVGDGPCPCSIHTRAWFFDEDGQELLSWDSEPAISSLSLALLGSARHDVVQGMWYQEDGVFGVFSDGTRPDVLPTLGTASYVGSIYGMLVESAGSSRHHEAVAALTLEVGWGATPRLSGRAGAIHAYELSIDTSTMPHMTLSSTLEFSGGEWSDEHKAFHNGSIGCLGDCETTMDSQGLWNAHFVDTGTVSMDPFMLSGTFGLYKYLFGSQAYDFIGFIHGSTPPPIPPVPPTIHIIDAYEVPRRASDLYRVLAGAGHDESRKQLANSVYAGSNAQSSDGSVVTISLVRDDNGKLLGSTGSFSVSLSDGWHSVDGPCPCSIYTRARFYDENGQELLSWDSVPNTSSLSLALLGSARHDAVQGMWYQEDGVFGVFSDGTRPDVLPTLGTASYVGSIYGMLVESAGSSRHHEAVAALTLEVGWGATPRLSGRAGAIHAYELSIDTSTMPQMTLSSAISFSGGEWSEEHKAFHNGSIGCGEGCEMTVGSQGLWNAHFVDTGTVSMDPFMLSGTFGLYKYLFGSQAYDFIGFIHGGTPPPIPPVPPTIHIIDAYEVPRRASDLYRVLAGAGHDESRKQLANSVYAGSNAQSSDGSVVTISLVRDDNGKLLGSTGSFSVSLSDGWHVGDGPCPCSIHTRAWFFDEDGQELLSWDSEPNTSSLSLALLGSARHDAVQGMWYQDEGVFGVFSDGTRPDVLPTLGTASYVGSIYGMLVESAGSSRHHEAVAALTLEVGWGATPTLSGRAGAIHAYELSIDTSTMPQMTLSSAISFSGGEWSEEHKAFHNGSIGCGDGCEMTVGSQGLWNAHFVDTGTVSMDPFMLSGTFGLYKYLFGSQAYDFIGFIHGSTPPPVAPNPPTIHIIDAYEVPWLASNLYHVLASSVHNDSRANLAASVYAGSNAQISDGSVVTVSLVRDNGKLLGSTGSFSVSLSDGWHVGDGPCPCSIHTRAWFFDEDGQELLSWDSDPAISSLSLALLGSARHDAVQGMWYQDEGVFGVFSDGTRPDVLPTLGTASYVGSIYGMLVESAGSSRHHEAVAALTLEVAWGATPTLSGSAGGLQAHEISIDAQGTMTSTMSPMTLSSAISFSGGEWSEEHKAFHNGSIGCGEGCEMTVGSQGLWNAHFVDTGTDSDDPFMLSGTFGLYKYLFGGNEYDFIGFIHGSTPPPVPPETPTIHIIDAYEVPRLASNLYQILAGSGHDQSRARLAASVYAGSNAQSSHGSVVTVSLARSSGNLLNPNTSFSLSSSYGWWRDGIGPCRCSIYTRATFYNEEGYELFPLVSAPNAIPVSNPFYASAKHGVIQGMWYQEDGGFGLFSDGTRPTATLRSWGSARYVGRIDGMLVPSTGSAHHHEAVAALTLSVFWGTTPSLYGRAGHLLAHEISIDALGATTSTLSHMTLASTIAFSGGEWSMEHKAFHNGSIGCLGGCGTGADSQGSWNAHFVDTGSGYVDPFILSGTFGLYKYQFGGQEYDFMGFIQGYTPDGLSSVMGRNYGTTRYSPGQAVSNKLVFNVFNNRRYGQAGQAFTTLDATARQEVIRSAAVISIDDHAQLDDRKNATATPLFHIPGRSSRYKGESTVLVWVENGFEKATGKPYVIGNEIVTVGPGYGHATYTGSAGGVYTSASRSGAFVSTIEVGVYFGPTGHSANWKMGYDFGGLDGTLTMTDGHWDLVNEKSFTNGSIRCAAGCVSVGDMSSWSALFINSTSYLYQGHPAVMAGKFGIASISHGEGVDVIDAVGIFTASSGHGIHAVPAKATYFPSRMADMIEATPYDNEIDRLVEAGNSYQRNILASMLYRSTMEDPSNPHPGTSPTLVRFDEDGLVQGGTIQLSTPMWDWRTGDLANCYCTMFLTGELFGDDGSRLPAGLSANPDFLSRHASYADASHGWIGGIWTRDYAPGRWHESGGLQMGIFVDGTAPATLPKSGSVTYTGNVFAVAAVPDDHSYFRRAFFDDGSEVLEGEVTLQVKWENDRPDLSGEMKFYEKHPFLEILDVELTGANWSVPKQRFQSGKIGCTATLCAPHDKARDSVGSWEIAFVDTGGNLPIPGVVAGAFAIKGIDLMTGTIGLEGDVMGWLSARPSESLSSKNLLLNSPGYSARLAFQQGFSSLFVNTTSEQKARAVTVDIEPAFDESSRLDRYGFFSLRPRSENTNFLYTAFWTHTSNQTGFSMGIDHLASSVTMPTSGSARYLGNAAGIYASSAGKEGVFEGDVSLSLQFASDGVEATGKLNLDFNGTASSFDMSLDDKFTDHVRDGTLVCATGCNGGTLKWGGSLLHTEDTQDPGEVPDGFFGQIKMHGVTMDSTITYDALGMFAAVKE